MRISGGESKGRRIAPPKHGGVRPTSDKVREALFSIFGARVENAVFLELFAGTGAVGIEALSRGASRAVFVDSSAKSARLVRENLESLGYRERAAVVAKDALSFLKKDAVRMGKMDLVFVDPPYHADAGPKVMEMLGSDELIATLPEDALVAYEHFRKDPAPERVGRLLKKKDYIYGDTVVSLYVAGACPRPQEDWV